MGNIFKNNEAIIHFSDNEQLTVFPKNSVWYKVCFDSNMVEFRSRFNDEVLFTENDITQTTINEEIPDNFITEFNQLAYASTPSKPEITDYDLLAVYNVTSTTEATTLVVKVENISSMYIDDEEVAVASSCIFEKDGEHTVKYKLKDNTTISNLTFYNCSSLTNITIPDSVTNIGETVFWNCISLTSINIPDSVTSIGTSAFSSCSGLKSVTIGSGVTSIGEGAFRYCSGLTSIEIPDSVTNIGVQAFYSCTSLTSIIIGSGVTSIGGSSFFNCNSLSSITFNSIIAPVMGDSNMFYRIASTGTLTYPCGSDYSNITSFYAFLDWEKVCIGEEPEQPSEPEEIDYDILATYNVKSTTSATQLYGNPFIISHMEVDGKQVDNATSYKFDSTGEHTVKFKLFDNTFIDEEAFAECEDLVSIVIPETVNYIYSSAFFSCGLTSITIPDSVKSLDVGTFKYCFNLTSVTFGNAITEVAAYCFEGCSSLNDITIPATITKIEHSAFAGCVSLNNLVFDGETAPSVFYNTFERISSTGTLSYPCGSDYSSVTSLSVFENWEKVCIGEEQEVIADITTIIKSNVDGYNAKLFNSQATYFVNSIDKMYVDGVEITPTATYTLDAGEHTVIYTIKEEPASDYKFTIYTGAFSGCTSITTAVIGERIDMIDNNSFNGCTSLESIIIPETIKRIGGSVFAHSGLKEFTFLPDTLYGSAVLQYSKVEKVTYLNSGVGANDCKGCKELTSVTFGQSLISIGNYAFQGCTSLTEITFTGTDCPAIGTSAFDGISVDGALHYDCNGDFFNIKLLPEFAGWQDDCTIQNADITTVIYVDDVTTPTQVNAETITTEWFTSTPFVEYVEKMYINGEEVTPTAYHQFDTTGYNTISYTLINNNEVPLAAFSGITSIVAVEMADSIHYIHPNAFELCTNLRSLTIPDSVINITNGAFYSCTSLSSVVFGQNIRYIGWNTFENCSSLNKLLFKGETAPEITSNSFAGIAEYGTIVHNCDANYNAIREYLSNWYCECPMFEVDDYEIIALFNSDGYETPICIDTSNVAAIYVDDVPVSLESASAYTFQSIGEHTVKYKLIDTSRTSYTSSGSGLNSLRTSMFYSESGFLSNKTVKACTQMVGVGINNSVQTIGDYTFAGANKLEVVQLPESIKAINTNAFSGCTTLEYVNITSLESWCNISFGGSYENPLNYAKNLYVNDELVSDLVIPENITSIKNYAFYKCSGLTSVTLHNNITSIGNYAFQDCDNIASIIIPDSVTSIGTGAFYSCNALSSVTIGIGVTNIGGSAFFSCKNLQEIISYPTAAPTIATNTFKDVGTGGTLKYYCDSTGYDAWLSTENYYLGLYDWNTECFN